MDWNEHILTFMISNFKMQFYVPIEKLPESIQSLIPSSNGRAVGRDQRSVISTANTSASNET